MTSLGNTNSWAKAGVMLRDSSAAGAMCVAVLATEGNGVTMQWRNATGGSSANTTIGGIAAPSASNPVWVMLVKSGSAYRGYYSLNGTTWTEVGSTSVTFSNAAYLAGLAVTSHNNGTATMATFDNVSVTAALPAGWSDADIGSPSPAGSATSSGGVYTLSGGGADIWNAADQFNLASETVSGDQTMIARVTSLGNTNSWAKAGVMFRDSSAAGAMCVDVLATVGNGVTMEWRSSTGGATYSTTIAGVAAPSASNPVWVMLVKSGNTYMGYYSLNGSTWTEVGSTSVTFSNVGYLAGLAVTSHNNGTATTATFDNVSVAPTLPSGWLDADIGSPSLAGSASCTAGVYTLSGNGSDIRNLADQFNYASATVSGDQTLVARVTSQGNTSAWAKAGVMFRDSLAAGSMFVDVVATPTSGVTMQWRNSTGGSCGAATTSGVAGPSPSNPVWVMLVKSGSLYTGYYSLNGSTWIEAGTTSLNFTNSAYLAGLAVTSQNTGTLSTATFDNVSSTAAAAALAANRLDGCRRGRPLAGRLGELPSLHRWGRGRGWGRLYGDGRRGRHLERRGPVQLRLAGHQRRPDAGGLRDGPEQRQRLEQGGRDVPRQSPLHLRGRGRG